MAVAFATINRPRQARVLLVTPGNDPLRVALQTPEARQVARVETAVDSGEGFATSLSDLEEVAPVEVPPALRDAAEAGVPTLASLQGSFPDAARAGLAAARAGT